MGQDKAQAAAKGRSLGQAYNAGLAHWLGSLRAWLCGAAAALRLLEREPPCLRKRA